jgi:[ribosomal protein S5]-alanine N-acetyltransferase
VSPPRLEGRQVWLRPLRRTDGVALAPLLRDRRATRWLPPRVRSETGPEFVRRVLAEQRRGGGPAFTIVDRASEEVVGQIRLIGLSRLERRAEVGYWLRRRSWGKGYATEALGLVCAHAFTSLELHRLEARVVRGNLASARVLEKSGFRREGIARRAARTGGGWADEWSFGLLRAEWTARGA